MSEDSYCSHSIFYKSCPSCLREELNAELAMKRVYIQQITTLEAALKEVVDAADGEGWGQLDPSLKKQRAALVKASNLLWLSGRPCGRGVKTDEHK